MRSYSALVRVPGEAVVEWMLLLPLLEMRMCSWSSPAERCGCCEEADVVFVSERLR